MFHVDDLCSKIKGSLWNTRGWTFQGLSSRRRLVFTGSEVYFQCQSMHFMERISLPLEELHIGLEGHRVLRDGTIPIRGLAFPGA
jgi:hypothetical protein